MSRRAARILGTIEQYTNKEDFIPDKSKREEFQQLISSLRERFFYGDEFNADFRMTLTFIEKYLDQDDLIELLSKLE